MAAPVRQVLSDLLLIEDVQVDDAHVVLLTGELDTSTARLVADHLLDVAADGDVVVDLKWVSFMDGAGVGGLVEGRRWVEWEGGRFEVQGATGLVALVLDLAGLW